MKIGVPKEIKTLEGRVALIPAAAGQLVAEGHAVFVQSGAGLLSGYIDDDYTQLGVNILPTAEAIFESAEMIIKVKEPQEQELKLLRSNHLLFSYLHLAAAPELMQQLLAIGLTAVAFETIETNKTLPLLAPMSDIAGRLSIQIGANLLQQPHGGRGLLLGGVPGTPRGHVVILGAGNAGGNAALMASALGARVTIFDRNRDKLAKMRALGANVTGLHSFPQTLERAVIEADLLVGAILVPGQRAQHLVPADWVHQMKPGSVIVDIAVDQGGCIETTRPTSYASPTFLWEQVVHFGVTNMPGAVPRTASQALSAALVPYILRLTKTDWEQQNDLQAGINVRAGEIVHPALQSA